MRERDGRSQVGERPRTLLTGIEYEGRPGGAGEHRWGVESHTQVEVGAAAGHSIAGRHRRQSLRDELLAEADPLTLDHGPVRLEQRERLGVEHDAPDVAQQPQRGGVDLLTTLLVQ